MTERTTAGDRLSTSLRRVQPMVNGVQTARVYQFGPFTLDTRTGELSHAGRRTLLRDQSLLLLLTLLERPDDLITREELTGRLWHLRRRRCRSGAVMRVHT